MSNRHDNNPSFTQAGWRGLADYLKSHVRVIPLERHLFDQLPKGEQAGHKDGPAVILAQFKRPGVRTDDEVVHTFGLGLDIDEKHVELDELKRMLDGTSAIIYESVRSQASLRRWRAFIEYARPLTPAEHAQAFEHWSRAIPGVGSASRNPSRLWYGVQRFKGSKQRVFEVLEGSPYQLPAQRPATSPRDAFLRNIKPPVDTPASEGDRNMQLARYCASLLAKSEVQDADELLGALLEKNDSYEPPLPEREVEQMARAKWARREKFGWQQGGSQDDEPDDDDDGSPGFDANELLEYEAGAVPWLVEEILTYGAHLLVGRPKGGKSWITLDMAYACANGGQFLGRQAQKTGVLWISGEDTKASLSRRLKVRNERFALAPIVMTQESLKAERQRWDGCSFDAWLRVFLEAHPGIGLVIMDTHATIEALWANEVIDEKRHASVVAQAYQMSRIYEDIGQETETCLVLVHHAAKRKGKDVIDYHELINLPATVVAGSTASLVLADPPDRDIHDDDDHRRVFAVRGRHIIGEAPLLIELVDARAKLLGKYHEIIQSEAQAETLAELELLLGEAGWPEQEAWVTYKQLASALGKHEKTIAGHFKVMKKDPAKMFWKQYSVVIKPKFGVTLKG